MRLLIILFFITLAGCGANCNAPVFNYEPKEFDGNCFVLNDSLMTKKHFDNVEKVLIFYNVRYERDNIFSIKLEKSFLPEMVYNYGTKAENSEFMKRIRSN